MHIIFENNNIDRLSIKYRHELLINPTAIPIIEKNLDIGDWASLCRNPMAMFILENHIDKIYWNSLTYNPNVLYLLEQYYDQLDYYCWYTLSNNPHAIHLIEKKHLLMVISQDVRQILMV